VRACVCVCVCVLIAASSVMTVASNTEYKTSQKYNFLLQCLYLKLCFIINFLS
jgi:hypothetical protein